jgi:hypothetical protein
LKVLTFSTVCGDLPFLMVSIKWFLQIHKISVKHFSRLSLSFKDQINVDMSFNIAYIKTVILRGDQHEAGNAESERGPR